MSAGIYRHNNSCNNNKSGHMMLLQLPAQTPGPLAPAHTGPSVWFERQHLTKSRGLSGVISA